MKLGMINLKLIVFALVLIIGCNGDNDSTDCIGPNCGSIDEKECSSYFDHNISSTAAVYSFISVTIGGALVDPLDTVGAFKDDVCVGTRQWNTSQCGSGICDIYAHGDEGSTYTDGYCVTGDIPTFKIFDASEDIYYEAEAAGIVIKNPSGDSSECEGEAPNCMEWSSLGIIIIDSLKAITASVLNCD